MSVQASSPIPWHDSVITGPVDTPSEAVTAWLNEKGFTDLSQLSAADLKDLINHLQEVSTQLGNPPGFDKLLTSLKNLESEWSGSTSKDPLEQAINDLEMRKSFADILAGQTDGQDGLDQVSTELGKQIADLKAAQKALDSPTSKWSDNDAKTVVDQVNDLINKIKNLRAQGFDTKAMGLDDLEWKLTAALDKYEATLAANPNDPKTQQLALSELRKSTAEAKLEYYKASGVDANDPRVKAEQQIIESEAIWQTNLNTPWDESKVPAVGGYKLEDLQANLEDLQRMYKDAVASGNTEAQRYLKERMALITKTISEIEAGVDPFMASCSLYLGLKTLDLAQKSMLIEQALAAGNQELADKLKNEMEGIKKMIEAISKEYKSIWNAVVDLYNAAIPR